MKINLKVRAVNWSFWFNVALAVVAPIMAYFGISGSDITTWYMLIETLKNAIMNPYVLFLVVVSVWNAINDPTTPGIKDSTRALSYTKPGKM